MKEAHAGECKEGGIKSTEKRRQKNMSYEMARAKLVLEYLSTFFSFLLII